MSYSEKRNKPRKIYFADIETPNKFRNDGVDSPKQLLKGFTGFYQEYLCSSLLSPSDEIRSFDNINNFMDHIKLNCGNSIIYLHNFGRFDFMFVVKYLVNEDIIEDDYKINRGIEVIERNNVIYEIKIAKLNISFRDSYLIIPFSLKKIGETFCTKFKKNDEFDYENIGSNIDEAMRQCENDCFVLKEGFTTFRNIIKKNFGIEVSYNLTIPSLAFNIFKKKYYDIIKTPIFKNNYEEDEFIRRS